MDQQETINSFKTIQYFVEDSIALIYLNRPERLNAWTGKMHMDYRRAIQISEDNPQVGAIIVTGQGRGFCAGADSKALSGHAEKGGYDPGLSEDIAKPGYGVKIDFDNDFSFHFGLTKPVIAAINGPAAGVGFVLACYCDFRFASKSAKFTTSHGKLGLPAEFGLSWLLPRLTGLNNAVDILMTSRLIDATEAKQLMLIKEVFEDNELLENVKAFTKSLIENIAPSSIATTKRQIYSDLLNSLEESMKFSVKKMDEMMNGDDYKEGVKSLMEKRKPNWSQK